MYVRDLDVSDWMKTQQLYIYVLNWCLEVCEPYAVKPSTWRGMIGILIGYTKHAKLICITNLGDIIVSRLQLLV